MLTKESSYGFTKHSSYPTYEYRSRNGLKQTAYLGGGRMVPKPKGYNEVIRYHNVGEDFAHYLTWLEDDHREITNEKLLESPSGCFLGRWRNARWMDEIKRRGLT